MFFAAPAPPPLRGVPSGTTGGRRNVLKPAPPQRKNKDQPSRANNQNPLAHEAGTEPVQCSAAEKLAFDELLRVQRGRAEDVGKLIAALGASLGAGAAERDVVVRQSESDKDRRAAKYREEWRIARENDVLDRIRGGESRDMEMLSAVERERKEEALRSHVRRSIHCFLMADKSSDSATAVTPRARRSNDLFYAQQMDRLLREMDQQHPFIVVRQAIADARAKFQQLVLCCSQSTEATKVVDIIQVSDVPPQDGSISTGSTVPETNLLSLYENVVDARSLAQPTPVANNVMTRGKTPRISTAATVLEPSAAFMGHLEKQRDEAETIAREALAQSHWRVVCAKRIRSAYERYRKNQQWRRRLDALSERTRHRSAIVLQSTFLPILRAFRSLADMRSAIMHRHQARRIAHCCFWRWIYVKRCGFATFQLTAIVTSAFVAVVVRVQSHWRRRHATRQVSFRRAFRSLRARRRNQRQWQGWRQRAQATALANQQLAEWHCRVAIEKRRVAYELKREQLRYTSEWAKYEARLEKDVLKSKLPSEWIPQLDPLSGETFYLNVQTTKTSSEHPNRALLRQLLRKQRARADELYEQRQRRLEQYAEGLEAQASDVAERFERSYRELLEKVRWDNKN